MQTQVTDYRKNSLLLIRYLAAFSVLWGHYITHFRLTMPGWINLTVLFFYGVPLFFSISGYTIWLSLERDSDYRRYFTRRFYRIYPELWLAVLASVVSIAALYPPVRSLSGAKTLGVFALAQGSVLQFWTPGLLRDFGVGTPNGALWTICTLIQFYVVAILFYRFIRNRSIWWWLAFFALSVAVNLLDPLLEARLPETAYKLTGQLLPRYFWLFMIGMFLAKYREKTIPFLRRFWYLFIAADLAVYLGKWDVSLCYGLFRSALLIPGVIGFAYAVPMPRLRYDCTYGIYIFHMVVANVFVQLGYVGQLWVLPVTIILTVLLSIGSAWVGKKVSKRGKKSV